MSSRFWLRFGGNRCVKCHRIWSQKDCIYWDDPMAPFGPEWLCPGCENLTLPVLTRLGAVAATTIAVAIGASIVYCVL